MLKYLKFINKNFIKIRSNPLTIFTTLLILCFTFTACSKTTALDKASINQTSKETSSKVNNLLLKKLPAKSNVAKAPSSLSPTITPTENSTLKATSSLSVSEKDWGFRPNSEHKTPEVSPTTVNLLKKYSAFYVGDTNTKTLYLTFDEGYENGYTPKILDILKENKVPAAFFVTVPYIKTEAAIIKRMVLEGHLVVNHTNHHPSMAKKANNIEAFNREFLDTEKIFKETTGKEMPKFFRPPMGKYSEKSLYLTQKLGYKTIFWSFAHVDWDINSQPSIDEAYKKIMKRIHNGSIILLHAVSKTNTEILDKVLKDLSAQGYTFKSLEDLK